MATSELDLQDKARTTSLEQLSEELSQITASKGNIDIARFQELVRLFHMRLAYEFNTMCTDSEVTEEGFNAFLRDKKNFSKAEQKELKKIFQDVIRAYGNSLRLQQKNVMPNLQSSVNKTPSNKKKGLVSQKRWISMR